MKHSSLILAFLLLVFATAYQNCSDVELTPITLKSLVDKCPDAVKDLTIIETRNSSTAGGAFNYDFQVFEKSKPSGVLIPFKPEYETAEWPPKWFKDNIAAENDPTAVFFNYDGVDKVIYRTDIQDLGCDRPAVIKASFSLCGGEDFSLTKFVQANPVCPQYCEEFGVRRNIGEVGDFYKSSNPVCGEACEKIQRTCLPTGLFGPALEPNATVDVNNYQQSSCNEPTGCEPPPPPPVSCTGSRAPPTGYTLAPPSELSGSVWGRSVGSGGVIITYDYFPPQSNQRFPVLEKKASYAYRFTVESGVPRAPSGGVNFDEWLGASGSGRGTISFSECPHDYSNDLLSGSWANQNLRVCKSGPSSVHALSFTYSNASPENQNGSCVLEYGKTYYFNVTTGNDDSLGRCDGDRCSPLSAWAGHN